MTREEVFRDMEQTLGMVPPWIQGLPDEYLSQEWEIQKRLMFGETNIPLKYKELIGIAISAAIKCEYCAYFHTEGAKMLGATPEEIQEASYLAKLTTGWSAYLHGIQMDEEQFRDTVGKMVDYVKMKQQQPMAA